MTGSPAGDELWHNSKISPPVATVHVQKLGDAVVIGDGAVADRSELTGERIDGWMDKWNKHPVTVAAESGE